MTAIVSALLPIFLLIALGWALKRIGFPGDGFWAPAERLVYFIFFPALLVDTLANADLAGFAVAPMAAALVSAILLMALTALLARRFSGLGNASFTSLFQGMIRSNSYVALAGATALLGDAGLTLASIAAAFVVPTVNILSVTVLAHYTEGQRPGFIGLGRLLGRNPLILACAVGITINLSGLQLPLFLDRLIEVLGRPTLPLALVAVGAGLSITALKTSHAPVIAAALFKLLLLPTFTALGCWVFGVEGVTRQVAVLFTAMPTAASSYVLARQLGGDAVLMASIVTVSTLGALASLPVVLTVLG